MPRVNEKIPLKLQLFDGNESKYVLANIYNADGFEIEGSPFSVPHFSRGLYARSDVLMPNTEYITVQYRVYNDAMFTSRSPHHADALDIFFREETDPVLLEKLNQIISLLESLIIGGIASKNIIKGDVFSSNIVKSLKIGAVSKNISALNLVGEIKELVAEYKIGREKIIGEI